MEITIYGETPSKKNSRINCRNGRSFPSKRYQEWHETAVAQVICQTGKIEPLNKVHIFLKFYHGNMARRDSDNAVSSIFDLLKDCGIISDDNWKVIPHYLVFNAYDKNNPRVEIKIYDVS